MPQLNLPAGNGIAGLLAGLFGAGQAGGGTGQGGVPGFFASLLGGEAGTMTPESLIVSLEELGIDLAALLEGLPTTNELPLPEGFFAAGKAGADVAIDLKVVFAHLQATVVEFQQADINLRDLGDSEQLAKALMKLGMSAEEAAIKATQIETMLRLVRETLGVEADDGATPGALLALVAASSTYLTPVQHEVKIDFTKLEADVRVISASVKKGAFNQQSYQSTNLARTMAGLDGSTPPPASPAGEAPVTTDAEREVVAAATQASKESAVPPPVAPAATKGVVPQVESDVEADGTVVDGEADAVGPLAGKEAAQAVTAASKAQETPRMVVPPVTNKVDRAEVAPAPQGVEIARLRGDEDGQAVMDRKVGASALREMQPAAPQTSTTQAPHPATGLHASSTLVDADGHTFADRLSTATRADVTQQAVVQFKGLANQGGGTVRMILNPPQLGEIRIEITVTGGRVEGSISASDNAVVELLARDVHSLRHGLAEAGLKLGDQGLSLMLNTNGQGNNGQQQPHGREAAVAEWLDDDNMGEGEATVDASQWVEPDRILDVRV